MNKQFIKSVAVGIMGLSLAASCSMVKKDHHKCNSNKCDSKKVEKSAKKDVKKDVKKEAKK